MLSLTSYLSSPDGQVLIDGMARSALRMFLPGFLKEDLEDVKQEIAIRAVQIPESLMEGKRPDRYIRKIATWVARAYASDILHIRVVRSIDLAQELDEMMVFDPFAAADDLRAGNGFLGELAYELGAYTSPPYQVVFADESTPYGRYRENPYFIPEFDIDPLDEVCRRITTRQGQKGSLNDAEVSLFLSSTLRTHRSRYRAAIIEGLKRYLRWYGKSTLKPEEKQLVDQVNLYGWNPRNIQRAMRIDERQFYRLVARLELRGWERRFSRVDNRERLSYNPVMDSAKEFIAWDARKKIDLMPASELLMSAEGAMYRTFENDEITLEEVGELVNQQRRQLYESADYIARAEAYDRKLRYFVKTLIEKPVYGKNMTLAQIEDVLRKVGKDRAADIVFRAIRAWKPIQELLGLRDYFAAESHVA